MRQVQNQSKFAKLAFLVSSAILATALLNVQATAADAAIAGTITSVTPSTGPIAGGTVLTITGTGFVTGYGEYGIVGGANCTSFAILSSTTATCTTPPQVTGMPLLSDVYVVSAGGNYAVASGAFTYLSSPAITSISPSSGPASGGTLLTINGSGFDAGATATVGGAACTPVTFVSANQITCQTTASAAGTVDVVETNSDTASSTLTSAFTYTPVISTPSITSVTPAVGPTSGGTSITIAGSGFDPAATVTIGGIACQSVVVTSSAAITCSTPAAAAGAATITVTNPDTGVASATNAFTYQTPVACLKITSISPREGSTRGGTLVTINGCGFSGTATVKIAGIVATVISRTSTTKIVFRTPAHAKGNVSIQVVNPDLTSASYTGFSYKATGDAR